MHITTALNQIRNFNSNTAASTDIQNCIKNKLQGFPERILENQHHATAYLPIGVAAMLKHKPNLIAAASQAFCNRDTIDMKACRAMKYFPQKTGFTEA